MPEGGSLLATQKASFSLWLRFFLFLYCKRVISHDIASIAYQPNQHSISHPTLLFLSFSSSRGVGCSWAARAFSLMPVVCVSSPFKIKKIHHGSKNTSRIKPKTQLAFLLLTFFYVCTVCICSSSSPPPRAEQLHQVQAAVFWWGRIRGVLL